MALIVDQSHSVLPLRSAKAPEFGELLRSRAVLARTTSENSCVLSMDSVTGPDKRSWSCLYAGWQLRNNNFVFRSISNSRLYQYVLIWSSRVLKFFIYLYSFFQMGEGHCYRFPQLQQALCSGGGDSPQHRD